MDGVCLNIAQEKTKRLNLKCQKFTISLDKLVEEQFGLRFLKRIIRDMLPMLKKAVRCTNVLQHRDPR